MNLYNQIKYNGYRINIYYDDDARSPREAYDNLGTLYTAHRRYRPEKEFDDHFDIDKVFEGHIGNFRESFLKEYIALPVYLYDHGGITISTSRSAARGIPDFSESSRYRWTRCAGNTGGRTSPRNAGSGSRDTCKTKSVPLTTTIPGKFSGIASCRKVTMTMNWTVVGDSMVRNV
mgnify:FL=1